MNIIFHDQCIGHFDLTLCQYIKVSFSCDKELKKGFCPIIHWCVRSGFLTNQFLQSYEGQGGLGRVS